MPLHQLLGQTQSVPASGEAIKSAETGLVAKCGTAKIFLGDGWEETMRVALRAINDERADLRTAETLWRNSETRNDTVITDSVTKLWVAKGGPFDRPILDSYNEALTILGFSPEQIARLETERKALEAERLAAEKAAADAAAAQQAAAAAPVAPTQLQISRDRANGITSIARVPKAV